MCQFLCCDCWWFNCLGVICGGFHNAYCLCSFWLCKPEDLVALDPDCCHVMACDGWGYNCCFWGNICCAPQTIKDWSRVVSGGSDVVVIETGRGF